MKRNHAGYPRDGSLGSFKETYGTQWSIHPTGCDAVVTIVRAYVMQVMVLSGQEQSGLL